MKISLTTKIKVSIKRFIQNIKRKIKKEKLAKNRTQRIGFKKHYRIINKHKLIVNIKFKLFVQFFLILAQFLYFLHPQRIFYEHYLLRDNKI